MIKVSIIIPVYNCEEYLEQCIKSVLCQTLKELEIICIDDGSADHSVQTIKKFQLQDKRIILIQQENQGAGAARNKGMRKAQGEYIAFLDADDYYIDPNALEIMYDTSKMKNVAICASMQMCMIDNSEHVHQLFLEEDKNKILLYKDYQKDYFYQSYLFQRELLINNDIFFPLYRRYQDPPFFVKAAFTAKEFTVIDTCLYCYRKPVASTRYTTKKVTDLLKGIIDNLEFALRYNLDILFTNTVNHLELEFTYIIYENITPNSLHILELLMKANKIIRGKKGDINYVIKPLQILLFPRTYYEDQLIGMIENVDKIALFGAGKVTKSFLLFLKKKKLFNKVTAIVVSDLTENDSYVDGIPVMTLHDFLIEKKYFLLVTVREKVATEIENKLIENKYKSYKILEDVFGDILLHYYM